MSRILLSSVAAVAMLASAHGAAAQTEIQWWHAMGGNLGDAVNALADGFNKSQKEYKVTPVYKGSYTETLTAAIAAFRAKQAPHIVQVFEVGTANMMAAKGAVYPVYQVMADAKEPFDPKAFIGPVYGYYSTTDGKLLSMPFNSSTPVLYWNKELFTKAGLDPEHAAQDLARGGRDGGKKSWPSGGKCGFTPQWQTWTMIENYGAWHNLPYRHQGQRLRRHRHRAQVQRRAARSSTSRCWPTGARTSASSMAAARASRRRCSPRGECAMHIASSGSAVGDRGGAGQGQGRHRHDALFDPTVQAEPQNSIIGGATLWVLQGRPAAEYKGVAKFMTYPVEHRGAGASGTRRPATCRSRSPPPKLTEKAGFYKKNPGRDIAVQAAHAQPADRELQGPAHRQLRADPRHGRRGARERVVGQEGRQDRRSTRR